MRTDRGDTIIEVVVAVTIFALVAVGGLALMNNGTAMAQRALEIGLVRQQIDAQADGLRYLNRSYVSDYGKNGNATKAWKKAIEENAVVKAADFDTLSDANGCRPLDRKAFALNLKKLGSYLSNPDNPAFNVLLTPTINAATYSQLRYETETAEGIWIQAVRWPNLTTGSDTDPAPANEKKSGYYDFHIRACWTTPGQSKPVTIGTIVRLYEPRG